MSSPQPSEAPLYLEDLTTGQRFVSTSRWRLEEDEIISFATALDPQPFHVDPKAAADSFFGGLVASGWQTAAISARLFVESTVYLVGGFIGYGLDELSWLLPVRPGDVLRAEAEVIGVRASRSKPDRGIVTFRVSTYNQHDQLVQVMVSNFIAQRRGR